MLGMVTGCGLYDCARLPGSKLAMLMAWHLAHCGTVSTVTKRITFWAHLPQRLG